MLLQSEKQLTEAAKWYRLSAQQGFTKAQINLALLYQQGNGVDKSPEQMLFWMKKAAEAGDPLGQLNMAEYTLSGVDKLLPKNKQQAEAWLVKAAAQHFQPAELMLAYWYEKGIAVTEAPKKHNKSTSRWQSKIIPKLFIYWVIKPPLACMIKPIISKPINTFHAQLNWAFHPHKIA